MFNTTLWRNPLGKFLRAVRDERGLSREALVTRIQRTTGHRLTASYYYRLEQCFRTPSADALDKIADGLEFSQAQREYAFSLIPGKPPPMTFPATVPDAVRRVVQLQQPISAYVVNRRMDLLAWNDTFCELYGVDLEAIDEQERNIVWLMFSRPNVSARLRDWEIHAQTIAAICRSQWSWRDNDIHKLLQRLLTFPQFATWWNQPRVSTRYFRKEIDHPDVGLLILEQTVHQVLACRGLYMVLLAPLPECETEDKLRMLLTLRAQRRQPAVGEAASDGAASTSGVLGVAHQHPARRGRDLHAVTVDGAVAAFLPDNPVQGAIVTTMPPTSRTGCLPPYSCSVALTAVHACHIPIRQCQPGPWY
jgi:transcriptional regulator with XRE-family HTH domain